MLAEVVDAVVGVDTHRDTHQVEIAHPTGTPIATISSTVFPSPVMAATGIARTLPRCLTGRSDDRQTRQM